MWLNMEDTLSFFDRYIQMGWEIIPILPGSKIPFVKGWNKTYDRQRTRDYIASHLQCNLGLRLGAILDVEADTPRANRTLERLVRGYPHPMYQSEKSTHHLFTNPDSTLTRLTIHGIEFRAYRHQSLVPPSVNQNGVVYRWLSWPDGPLPAVPEALINLYNHHTKMLQGSKVPYAASPTCSHCGRQFRMHVNRYRLEKRAFRKLEQAWQCQKCREIDIRSICRKIRSTGITN